MSDYQCHAKVYLRYHIPGLWKEPGSYLFQVCISLGRMQSPEVLGLGCM